jgi:imidazolonepropionase-like amidohydrolase
MMAALVLAADFWIAGGTLVAAGSHRAAAVHVRNGRIAAISAAAPKGAEVLDATGLYLVPAAVDAHVHLSVAGELPAVGAAERKAGLAAVLDLGEPERLLARLSDLKPLRVLFSGPLCTAPRGYPTQSWGKDGYGLPLANVAEARAAVERLHAAGASMLKLAFDGRYAVLDPAVARAAVEAAHKRHLKVAAHALDVAMVRRALDAGVDVLAHAPVEPLPAELIAEIGRSKLHVISTLKAFGGSAAAIENVRQLKGAGARIVYGTDLGNTGTAPGIDASELDLLARAGLTPVEILDAATRDAAELLGLSDLGTIDKGQAASLLGLRSDPLANAGALAAPALVLLDGVRQ